ncbi:MAG TPA: hypothetical protein PLS49_08480 [Candidatus Woesebacteria bacterium]|nr:hypothetical protein [Candidatus Woesebacteria bacterium]
MKTEQSPIWKRTISGKIYEYIQNHLATPETHLQINDAGKLVETISFNGEEAHIRKRIQGNMDNILTCIESYEYKRLNWWRETIDAHSNISMILLDPPIMWVAKDAGIIDWEDIFKPSHAIRRQDIYSGYDRNKIVEAQGLIRNTIMECFSSKFLPHYSLQNTDGALRVTAESAEGIESRTEDNETYTALFPLLQEGVPQLLQSYKEIQI